MEIDNRKLFLLILFTLTVGIFLYLARRVLTPFMIAFVLAYLLDPLVDWLESKKCSRTLAVVLLIGVFFSLIFTAVILLFPVLQDQVERLAYNVPRYIQALEQKITPLISQIALTEPEKIRQFLKDGLEKFGALPLKIVSSTSAVLWNSLSGLVNLIFMAFNFVIIPVAMFYLLRDYDTIVSKLRGLVPPRFRDSTCNIFLEIDQVLANFIRGQLMVASMMAGLYSIGLFLCGTPLSLVIGLVAGLANLVPYLGVVLGFLPAGILTYLHFQEFLPLLGVLTVFGIAQALEGMVITPRIVGDQIGLHPVVIMIAVLIGGEFFGLFGVLLGVPAAAVINVLLKRGLDQYRSSAFYS